MTGTSDSHLPSEGFRVPTAGLLYACTIFTGAFLLFQIQPVIAKIILPWFGGSAAVWTTCMLFFQAGLLLGYAYAHWSIRSLSPRTHVVLHLSLLAVSLLLLRVIPSNTWKPSGDENPLPLILGVLVVSVGLPYFLLSSTSPLVQAWYVKARRSAMPYRLYALSNLASLLALLSYPVAVEPVFGTRTQAFGWSIGYGVFVVLCGTVALLSLRHGAKMPVSPESRLPDDGGRPAWNQWLLWLLLSTCSCTLLLAITNHLCQNVASIPFLWVLPLSLYLLSFIVCFHSDRWYRRPVWLLLLAVSLIAMTYSLSTRVAGVNLKLDILLFAAGLFACCMFCHGELATHKPHPSHLTSFYLMISAGAVLGGVFVGLVAPSVFNGHFELPIGLAACAALAVVVTYRMSWMADLASIALTVFLIFAAGAQIRTYQSGARVVVRNFYGGLRVVDEERPGIEGKVRVLLHGSIIHGSQFLSPGLSRQPTTYFGKKSGVACALESGRSSAQRVGVVGLGAGTIASYAQAEDVYRFYEINPLVIQIADEEFSYLREVPGRVEVVVGDARISMERERPQNYDVLVIDAFSGDSIPLHLLSREAFQLYFQHLKPAGILAAHVSNHNLELRPVVQKIAESLGKDAWEVVGQEDKKAGTFSSTWVLVGDKSVFRDRESIQAVASRLQPTDRLRLWTDDYSNLFQILK